MELCVDSEVGTIVWVRRRNGSWWPGKILGGDELPASHLMSPRSGTPVKLLGREDASVDWYNLEKSKRVKAFRCGEFDQCIERAQASQGIPPKKREKYARREDAILHALELEKQFLHHNNNNPVPLNSKHPSSSSSSFDLSIQRKKPQRHEIEIEIDEEEPKLLENTVQLEPPPLLLLGEDNNNNNPMEIAVVVSGDSSDHTPDHLLKPDDEDHQSPMLQIQDYNNNQTPLLSDFSTPKSSFPFGLLTQQDNNNNNTTEEDDEHDDDDEEEEDDDDEDEDEEEDTETDSSGTESISSDTYDATLSDDADQIEFIPKVFGRSETGEDESMSDADESDESPPTSVTVSKWQLKGKRNTRSLMKRYRNDNKLPVGSSQWMSYRGGEDNRSADSFDKRLRSQPTGFNMPSRDIGLDSSHDMINSMEGYWEQQQQQPTDYHDSSVAYMSSLQFGGTMKSMLIDVDVQVQSGYQREHVPMISLMSKLNDKAIVGHPIPVETMQDGSSDHILSTAQTYEYQTESLGLDPDDTALQPWRTARRTAKCRVPRPPAQDEYAATTDEEERKQHINNRKGGSISRKWPTQKKAQKRSVLSHSQKIRTLSSIGGGDLRADEEGMMKPAVAAVACIPVKLVFSRLHEELVARHQ